MKPVVDRLKPLYEGKVEFRAYNLDRGEGEREYRDARGQYVPMFVLVNADGVRAESFVGEVAEDALKGKLDALR